MEKLQIVGEPLIKFTPTERVDGILKGNLYMKRCQYFRDKEKETSDDTVGDALEALWHINEAYIFIPDTGEFHVLKDTGIQTTRSNDFVFCMFGIGKSKDQFSFTEKQKTEIKKFGDSAIVITDTGELRNRIMNAANERNLQVRCGYVSYYDNAVDSAETLVPIIRNMGNVAFLKRNKYAYQQEYRVILNADGIDEEDHFILEIGDISDIAVVIDTEKILNSVVKKKEGGAE